MTGIDRIAVLVAYIFLCAISVESKANYFTPCQASDPKLEECLKTTAQKVLPIFVNGIPDLNLEPFEEYKIEDVHEIQPSLQIHFTNITLFGSGNSKITGLKLDPIKKKITLNFSNLGIMKSNYKADGRLLVLPVKGDGKAIIKMDIDYDFKIYYDLVKGNDGKDHMKIVQHKANFSPNSMDFQMTNLFNGNKQLADVVVKFVNDSWRSIFPEIGTPVMIKVTERMIKQIGKFLNAFPASEILLP
ncbi:circadian clock-controlled protein daywake-like [Arctopsyche grandis]|uniref:circadian clock-controlled protein daywake-like n=1 Tax=Arctopsyche grandis TaxID=121162 RepID=UPI00406D7C6A